MYVLPLDANHSSSCFLSKDPGITVTTPVDHQHLPGYCFPLESPSSQLQQLGENICPQLVVDKPKAPLNLKPTLLFSGASTSHSSQVRGLWTLFSADWCRFTQLNTSKGQQSLKQGQSWPKLLLTCDLLLRGSWEHASPVCHLPVAALV